MWNKIKNIILYIIRAIFLLSLIMGYFLSVDYWIKEINIDFGTGMLLAIIIACISLYQINKEDEERKHNNEIEQKEIINLIKLLYETNYSNLKSIDSIVVSNAWAKTIFINMKNGYKINLELSDISWIKGYEDIQKLDDDITNNPKNSEIEYTLFLMGVKFDHIK